ncbi:DUF427 domain-containing protein [Meiothermus sp.]|uniref:DUF427 domain-containing protein n=1 Tax=Meiothermus sp. TaxID=1955249 RepID=UPI0021DDFEAE|nr:DUF427 domain-containing protein [Meiothermus sp.]GIW34857.1 MAG: hypothetical protein KatS3mg072_2190 [Meiothermus sp.]
MESVWDYPRPPRCEPTSRRIQVRLGELIIADSNRAYRVLETSHPPVYYLPPADIRMELLEATARETHCEFKGRARYWTLRTRDTVLTNAAWSYPDPTSSFSAIRGYLAFYLEPLEGFVDGEKAKPQPGRFYGGWITQGIAGPFKGGPGSSGW